LLWRVLVAAGLLWLGASELFAATATGSLTVNARITSHAKITLDRDTINFVDLTQEFDASIPANENPVNITAKARTGTSSPVTLTFLAADDLRSDVWWKSIAISNVTWTAMGSGFHNGTMNKTSAQTVGTWTGPGSHAGTLSFFLKNSLFYFTGSYQSSGTFTLTAP